MGRCLFMRKGNVHTKPVTYLPAGYTELAYIQSSGTQFINTGFKPSNNTRVICDFQLTNTPSSHVGIFGARGAASGYAGRYAFGYNDGFRTDFGTQNISFGTSISTTARYTVDKNKTVTTLSYMTMNSDAATFNTGYNLCLLAINTAGKVENQASAKLYSCKIYDNDVLVRDFVPCINNSDEVGLYDLVGKQFYGNAGTDVFTGSEVA